MSDDKSDKAGGWFGNPLPIVMVVLLAGGVLVKNIPLESARPTDPERVKFVPTSQQDVEARLWQDPFSAVEKHKKSLDQAITPTGNIVKEFSGPYFLKPPPRQHTPDVLLNRIYELKGNVTVLAVSVFGASYAEDAESRRRSRFAVISALGFHGYHPEDADAIGYFHIDIDTSKPKSNDSEPTYDDDVPYEWFGKEDTLPSVLVLWLKDEKLTATPLKILHKLFNELTLTPPHPYNDNPHNYGPYKKVNIKLIGPAGSGTLRALVLESPDLQQQPLPLLNDIEVYSPSATISNCDLLYQKGSQPHLDCVINPPAYWKGRHFRSSAQPAQTTSSRLPCCGSCGNAGSIESSATMIRGGRECLRRARTHVNAMTAWCSSANETLDTDAHYCVISRMDS